MPPGSWGVVLPPLPACGAVFFGRIVVITYIYILYIYNSAIVLLVIIVLYYYHHDCQYHYYILLPLLLLPPPTLPPPLLLIWQLAQDFFRGQENICRRRLCKTVVHAGPGISEPSLNCVVPAAPQIKSKIRDPPSKISGQ